MPGLLWAHSGQVSTEDDNHPVRVQAEFNSGFLGRCLNTMLPKTPIGWAYVFVVAAVAGLGFTTGSTSTIVLAAVLALPMGLVALPAFYVVYGLLAQIPGANPGTSTGSAACGSNDDCQVSTTGDLATWFAVTTGLLGVLALTAAALVNVSIFGRLIAALRERRRAS
jgi:hypothetical protein